MDHPDSERIKLHAIVDCWQNQDRARTAYLLDIGRLSREYVEMRVERIPKHDLAGRRERRAEAVKDIEEALREAGEDAPQVSRWMRFAVLVEAYPRAKELPQGALIHLIRWVERDVKGGESWSFKHREGEGEDPLKDIVEAAADEGLTAAQVRDLMDEEETLITGETKCLGSQAKNESTPPTSASTSSNDSCSAKPSASGKASNTSEAQPSRSTPTASPSSKPTAPPASTPSKSSAIASSGSKSGSSNSKTTTSPSAPSSGGGSTASPMRPAPSVSRTVPASATRSTTCSTSAPPAPAMVRRLIPGQEAPPAKPYATPPTAQGDPQAIALQIFKLLQDDQILAGVFRRVYDGDQFRMLDKIVENAIQADAQRNKKALGLAYKRLKPTALTFWSEKLDEHENLRLVEKPVPCAPTAEELAPNAMAMN